MTIADTGRIVLMELWRGSSQYEMSPFINDVTPGTGSVYADFTKASMALPNQGFSWGAPSIVNGECTMVGTSVTFTNWTAPFPVTVYGYFVHKGLVLLCAARFASPVVVTTTDQQISKFVTFKIP